MMDRITEALTAARDAAVEERAIMYGSQYASALEGYGDLSRELINMQNSVKALKKCMADIVRLVGAQELQQLHNELVLMEGKANAAAYDALRMCAAVRILEETIRERSGGDLLDQLEGGDE